MELTTSYRFLSVESPDMYIPYAIYEIYRLFNLKSREAELVNFYKLVSIYFPIHI